MCGPYVHKITIIRIDHVEQKWSGVSLTREHGEDRLHVEWTLKFIYVYKFVYYCLISAFRESRTLKQPEKK